MKLSILIFVLFSVSSINYSQEIIYQEDYINLPFSLRIDNSGIYSIASFDIENDTVYFSSFNSKSIFKFYGNKYVEESFTKLPGNDFLPSDESRVGLFKKMNRDTDALIRIRKNYSEGSSLLYDDGGDIQGMNGEKIQIAVDDRNELKIISNLVSTNKRITVNFPSDLACADLIGIDRNGNLFLLVEKYISEIPILIRREVYTISKNGEILSTIELPQIKFLYTIKDLQIDSDGNLYQLLTLKDQVKIVKWKNLTEKNPAKLYYPDEYKYELHYNNFTPLNEAVSETENIHKTSLTKASRTKALQIAETYVVHQYNCNVANLAVNQVTAPDGDAVRTPGWLVIGSNARVPYKWGGFNTIAQFDAGLTSGKYAGDIITSGVSSYALGVDCSGYVSRCWQLSYHSSTSNMPGITTQYASWDQLKPGDAIHRVGHVRLFVKRNTNGTFKVVEAAGRNWDVSYWSYAASDLVTYTPRRFNDMEDNFNSQQPELYYAEATSDSSFQVKWKCNTDSILGYRIYHSVDGSTWKLILIENNIQSLYATIISKNKFNFFRVSSVKNDAPDYSESSWSNVLGAGSSSAQKKVLIVDGFERENGSWQGAGHPFVTRYGKGLGLLNIDFSSAKNSGLLNGSCKLENYNYVFWILGDESTLDETFSVPEQELVKKYLEDGGNIFVSGSEVGWDLDYKGNSQDKSFYNNYLKARFISDNALSSAVKGISNSSLKDINMNFGQTYYEDYPDEIEPLNGSRLCVLYSNNRGAGIEFTGYFGSSKTKGSLIYLAFPLESTADDASFNTVITKAVNYFDSGAFTAIESDQLSTWFNLEQNFPNPFNPSTVIRYTLPLAGFVSLKIYDVLGREVATLVDGFQPPGFYKFHFPTSVAGSLPHSQLTSGVYFYRLQSGRYIQTRKMILAK